MKRKLYLGLVIIMLMTMTASAFAEDKQYDLGGATVVFENMWGADGIPNYFDEGGAYEGYIEEAEELFNCKITFTGSMTPDEIIAKTVAGEMKHTILYHQCWEFYSLVVGGYLTDLTTVLPEDYWDNLPPLARALALSHNYLDGIYGFGVGYQSYHVLELMAYNKGIIEREGLEDPMDLYEAGNWTWDKYTELAKAATRDTDGDGEIDQWGMSYMFPGYYGPFFTSNDVYPVVQDDTGKYVFGYLNNVNALNALNQLYNWINVDKIFSPGDWSEQDAYFKTYCNTLFYMHAIYQYIGLGDYMKDDFGLVPVPNGPDRNVDYHAYPFFTSISFMLPAGAENPEALVALVDFLYPPEDFRESYDVYALFASTDERSYNVLMEAFELADYKAVNSLMPFYHASFDRLFAEMRDNGLSASAALDVVAPEIQANIDNAFNK